LLSDIYIRIDAPSLAGVCHKRYRCAGGLAVLGLIMMTPDWLHVELWCQVWSIASTGVPRVGRRIWRRADSCMRSTIMGRLACSQCVPPTGAHALGPHETIRNVAHDSLIMHQIRSAPGNSASLRWYSSRQVMMCQGSADEPQALCSSLSF
jgi:hypothetical protein